MIKIFSTYTRDKIYNQDNGLKIIRNGGPAFFIKNVFEKNKVNYKISASKADINIQIINGAEKGVLASKLKERKINNIKGSDIILISTVDREWILPGNFPEKARIFLDVQGYVRSARKNPEIYKSDFWNNIFCLKTNDREIKELPKNIVRNQKNKCLIITKGSKGATIYFKNKKYIFTTKKIKLNDTIGAGDTFFTGFIVEFIKSRGNITKSGKFATEEAENFLLAKNIENL